MTNDSAETQGGGITERFSSACDEGAGARGGESILRTETLVAGIVVERERTAEEFHLARRGVA